MFRQLPPFGGDQRAVAEIVNGIMNGKTNNTGTVTLATGGATSTTLTDARIGVGSVILLAPSSITSAASYVPYGSFQDLNDQTIASTTTAYPMLFDTTDFALGMSVVDGSKIKVDYSGLYNFQFSSQFVNTDSQIQDISVWFSQNGINIPNSNGEFTITERHGSIDGSLIATFNLFIEMAKDDYVQINWRATNTAVSMQYIPAQTSPTRPATPSVILTVSYVSPNAFTTNLFAKAYVSSVTNGSATITHPANSVAGVTYDYVVVG